MVAAAVEEPQRLGRCPPDDRPVADGVAFATALFGWTSWGSFVFPRPTLDGNDDVAALAAMDFKAVRRVIGVIDSNMDGVSLVMAEDWNGSPTVVTTETTSQYSRD